MSWKYTARKMQIVVLVALSLYFLFSTGTSFAIYGFSTNPNRELFPFFTWSLFSDADDKKIEYGILIVSLNGDVFSQAVDWRDVEELPSFNDSRSLGLKAARAVGSKTRSGAPEAESLRIAFEQRYFGNHDVEYKIIRSVYNPMLLWRDGAAPHDQSVIGTYRYSGRS